jgi:hypothetical protein
MSDLDGSRYNIHSLLYSSATQYLCLDWQQPRFYFQPVFKHPLFGNMANNNHRPLALCSFVEKQMEKTSDVLCLSRSSDKHSKIDSRKSSENQCSITRLGSPCHYSRSFRYFSYSCIFACKPITILQLRSIPTSTAGPRGDDIYDTARLYQHVQ